VISKLQEEDDNKEVDPDVNNDNNDNEIDSAVKASDNAMIDNVIWDLEQDLFAEEMLMWEDINLEHFSLSKVCSSVPRGPWHHFTNFLFLTSHQLQLTNLGKKIFNSSTLHTNLKSCCEHVKIKPVMIRAVFMRWNTTAELIGHAKDLHPPLNLLINME
jgi:hypothetical protein